MSTENDEVLSESKEARLKSDDVQTVKTWVDSKRISPTHNTRDPQSTLLTNLFPDQARISSNSRYNSNNGLLFNQTSKIQESALKRGKSNPFKPSIIELMRYHESKASQI